MMGIFLGFVKCKLKCYIVLMQVDIGGDGQVERMEMRVGWASR